MIKAQLQLNCFKIMVTIHPFQNKTANLIPSLVTENLQYVHTTTQVPFPILYIDRAVIMGAGESQ